MTIAHREGVLPTTPDLVADAREAAVARAREVFVSGDLAYEGFSHVLDEAYDARDHADLVTAVSTLPPPVRLTPPGQRLPGPLLVRTADGAATFGHGWQLAAETTVATGTKPVELDLAAASWDAPTIHLHLESWGMVGVVVPAGVAVQVAAASVPVRLEPLALTAPGAPVLRISALGPSGMIRVSNLGQPDRRRRRRHHERVSPGRTPNPLAP